MQTPQAQQPRKDDSTSQAFNDVLKSFLAVFDSLIRDFSALVVIFIFILLLSVFLILRAITRDYTYPLSITFIFMLLSLGLYFKDKSILSAIIAFSLGNFTAFTVPWNGSTFSIFVISFILLLVSLFLFECVRRAANVQEKLTKAAIAYISDVATNKKDLKEVAAIITQYKRDKGRLLSTPTLYDAILLFAHHKVPKSRMILLITALSDLYTLTKVDPQSLLLLLKNMNYVSQTEEDLATNLIALQHIFLEARSTQSDLVTLLNDALPIAIENEIEFGLFTNTMLTYLSRGYAQARIVEKLSRQFTKKTQ